MVQALQEFALPALIPQVPLINVKTGVPTQFFMDYMNTLNSKLTNAVQALNNAVDGLLAAQAQSVAQQAQVITQAQSVATAQGQADAAAGSPAQSGDAMGVISVPAGAGWTAGPQVDLLGVIAGSLSVINSGPSQISATAVGMAGSFSGSWRIQEIVGAVETTVYTGTFTAENWLEDLMTITNVSFLYNDADTSAAIPGQVSVGAVSYRLDMSSPDVDVTNVQAYIYVRRS